MHMMENFKKNFKSLVCEDPRHPAIVRKSADPLDSKRDVKHSLSKERKERAKSARARRLNEGSESRGALAGMLGVPPSFLDVWQTKDFKSNDFGSVARKGVRESFFGCVANTRVSGLWGAIHAEA
jgi:hypothetical protein